MLGEGFDMVIVCDGGRSYHSFTVNIQRDWAHLLREADRLAERVDEAEPLQRVLHRRYIGRENPADVLSVKDRIDVEGPEYKRVVYKRLRALVEGFIGRVKCRLGYGRLTWQGLENVGIHVSLVLMVVYAVCIAAYGIGRPELRQSVAFFA